MSPLNLHPALKQSKPSSASREVLAVPCVEPCKQLEPQRVVVPYYKLVFIVCAYIHIHTHTHIYIYIEREQFSQIRVPNTNPKIL